MLCLLAGCSFKPDSLTPDGDQPPDTTPIDAPPDVVLSDAPCSFSTQFDTCVFMPTVALEPGTLSTYNTDTHVLSDNGTTFETLGPDRQADVIGKSGVINVLLVTTFELRANRTFRVIGSKPFGIVASEDIIIDGLLDASSTRVLTVIVDGAGSLDAAACGTATPTDPGAHDGGAGGGGGGAFQGAGGFGQEGDDDGANHAGALGGIAVQSLPPGPRGGCPGGKGGSNGQGLSDGGRGGGAIYLVAADMIFVKAMGKVAAGGAGGEGGRTLEGGGAGGGSGGMILVEADRVKIDGLLAANGGAGGGGAGGVGAGGDGGNAFVSSTMAAGGGVPSLPGGAGEAGSVGNNLNGVDNDNQTPNGGGGGGGGGAGVISVKSPNQDLAGGAKFSPPRTDLPD